MHDPSIHRISICLSSFFRFRFRLEFDLLLFFDLQIQIAQLEIEGLDWIGLNSFVLIMRSEWSYQDSRMNSIQFNSIQLTRFKIEFNSTQAQQACCLQAYWVLVLRQGAQAGSNDGCLDVFLFRFWLWRSLASKLKQSDRTIYNVYGINAPVTRIINQLKRDRQTGNLHRSLHI
jgi:hypothetical protein